MKKIPPNQLSFDDYLARHRWCGKHRRLDCNCGRKRQDFRELEEAIIQVMRYRASGRVAVSSEWIAIQLLIDYGIDRTGRSVRYQLSRMRDAGKVIQAGNRGEYKIAAHH